MLDPIALATPHVGAVLQARPVNGFVGNQTFRLETRDGVYYLKAGPTVADEADACRRARSVGVPAPEVVASPAEYVIMRELPGGPLAADSPDLGAVLRTVGERIRRVHTIVDVSASWADRLWKVLDGLDVLPDGLAARVRAVVPGFVEYVAGVTPALLHGDLHLRHVYAEGPELTGILDWGDATYGDPLFDLARLSMAGPEVTAAFLAGYGVVDAPARTLSMYRALWSLIALQAEHAAGGDWIQPHLGTIAREIG
ncbi:phosphotransferase family enzyme [Kribbella sp. VKM Ac-2571]|uniref:phosphotransferase family protein n=1 Tax=Kribbella sp. VKM Ac-2571 TaxID=2512222 RepID=UPI00105CD46D|nr:aminoglycoside phosphotransferase family protein [Kribbella sp. VKM Ac-2571]TDO46044.1 phosphotransferase family enzyme [Kribbella sp. VKM Ac-2571]